MSAPSPMCRTAILILALLVVGAPFVFADAPVGPVHPHGKAAAHDTPGVHVRRSISAQHPAASEHRVRAKRPAHRVAPASYRRAAVREAHRTSHSRLAAHSRIAEERSVRRHAAWEEARRASEKRERERREVEAREARVPAHLEHRPSKNASRSLAARLNHRHDVRLEEQARIPDARAVRRDGRIAQPIEARDEETKTSSSHSPETSLATDDSPRVDLMPDAASFTRGGMPPPLRGSLASLERQDERLEADGLERIEDDEDLSARIEHHLLVPLPASDALTVDAELPLRYRFCRPWTARFLTELARGHEAEFHRPIEVSSAVRTVVYQARLMRINGNAAPAMGDIFSPHLMGATIDIAKKEMSRDEIAWMRRHLLALELAGKIDVEEEFEQACFHITVYRSYAPPRAGHELQRPNQASAAGKAAATGMM